MRDGILKIAHVVEAVEGACNVRSLLFFDGKHQLANISWNRAHPNAIQSTLQHLGLNSSTVEWGTPLANSGVRIFTEKQLDLFESPAIGLYARKTAHRNDRICYFQQLVHAWHILSG